MTNENAYDNEYVIPSRDKRNLDRVAELPDGSLSIELRARDIRIVFPAGHWRKTPQGWFVPYRMVRGAQHASRNDVAD